MKKHLVFIGGGHSHVLVLKHWESNPLPELALTLVSPSRYTPYSGMLPGLVAGHYRYHDTHIDLLALCQHSGVEFVEAAAQRVDVDNKRVLLNTGQSLSCDLLSIDSGSTPDLSVSGADEHAVPVKPIAGFYERWQSVIARLRSEDGLLDIGVVGGGAAGVELIMAMAHFWQSQDLATARAPRLHLLQQGEGLPEHYPPRFQRVVAECFRRYSIRVHSNFSVSAVKADGVETSGKHIKLDEVFWCTHASAPSWPRESGIATTERGFIAVNDSLQSLSHPWIFAAGDVADQVDHPHPKAGVYAVRQAATLQRNLRGYLSGETLSNYIPQSRFLSLLACGEQYAVGSKYGLTINGRWVWHWKNKIDKKFMAQFPREE